MKLPPDPSVFQVPKTKEGAAKLWFLRKIRVSGEGVQTLLLPLFPPLGKIPDQNTLCGALHRQGETSAYLSFYLSITPTCYGHSDPHPEMWFWMRRFAAKKQPTTNTHHSFLLRSVLELLPRGAPLLSLLAPVRPRPSQGGGVSRLFRFMSPPSCSRTLQRGSD